MVKVTSLLIMTESAPPGRSFGVRSHRNEYKYLGVKRLTFVLGGTAGHSISYSCSHNFLDSGTLSLISKTLIIYLISSYTKAS